MIKSKNEMPRRPIEIDLTGPEGNVFVLMAYAKRLSKQLFNDMNEELEGAQIVSSVINELCDMNLKTPEDMGDYITEQMMASDYENAVQVFDMYFGGIVTLYR